MTPATSNTPLQPAATQTTSSLDEAEIVGLAMPSARASQELQQTWEQLQDAAGPIAETTTPAAHTKQTVDSPTDTKPPEANSPAVDASSLPPVPSAPVSADQPQKSKESIHAIIPPINDTAEEAASAADNLRSQAEAAEKELAQTQAEISKADEEIQKKAKATGTPKGATVAGYPVTELAKAFFRPPKPADTTDPQIQEVQNAQKEIKQTKQQVKEAKKEIANLKQQADQFQKAEQKSVEKLQSISE